MAQFNFIYDPNVSLEQRIGFEMAAAIWSTFLTDDVDINLRVSATDGLNNNQAVGGAVPIFYEQHYGVYQEYVEQDATSDEDAEAIGSLQDGNTVDLLIDGEVIDGNSTIMLTSAQAKALGMSDPLQLDNGGVWDQNLVDAGALDGYIVVNNSYDWNYDFTRESEAPPNTLDFLTMALHEIGHNLGFVSGLDGLLETFELHSGETQAAGFTALDMFRHTIDSQAIDNPDGQVADLTLGANAHFSLDGETALADFSTGQNTEVGGDGYQASHWERYQQAVGIMDPTLGYQERTDISHLDLQAFDALGWDINYATLEQGLDFQALYAQATQAIADDFSIGVAAIETAVSNGQDWYTLGYGSWWQSFKDQMIEMGYGAWWQQFEADMLEIGYGTWWQAFDQDLLEMGYGGWWQAFEAQVLEMGYGSWWQQFEADMLEIGYGQWWQQFEPQMLEISYGGWWQVFEQQMLAIGYGGWWQEFEAKLLEIGYGSWWQAFESQVLEMGYGSWWQIFEDTVIEMGYGQWWQEFEANILGIGYGQWWQAFEIGYGSWWQQLESHMAHLTELEAATSAQTPEEGATTGTTSITGGAADDILAGSAGSDLISGDAGDDLIDGKAGNDILLGDEGNDIVYGWDGDDVLYGGAGDDLLAGENGNDRLYGEAGHDILAGGRGHDILEGGDGRDVLKGDTGNDVLNGDADVDNLSGGTGDDILIGGEGEDILAGGEGDDRLYGDAYNPMLYSNADNPTDTSATDSSTHASTHSSTHSASDAPPDAPPESSEELLSSLGVSTTSNLLDFWIRLEAEDLQLTNYNSDQQGEASNGQVISTSSGFLSGLFKSKAWTNFSGPTGAYQLIVGYYDDNANTSEATLRIKSKGGNGNGQGWLSWLSGLGEVREEHSWLLDQGVGNASSSDNFFTYVIDDVNLESGDRLEILGDSEGNEQVRIDYIDIIAVNEENQIASDGSDKLLETAFYNGNFYAVASSVATAAAEAASRGGELISVEAGSQLAIWLQNTLGATANIIEIQGEVDAVNLVTSNQLSQSNPQRIEAEALTFSGGYSIASETNYDISASGNSLLTATNTVTPSSAQITIETAGIYNLYANYFDGDNGVAEATVLLNGTVLNSWQFNQDDNQIHSRILGLDVILAAGDVLELQALADGGDQAAIDYFTLEESTEQGLSILTADETDLPSLRFEAEDMDLSASQHSHNRYESAASGNYVVYTSNKNDGLTATTSFTGATGIYDIVVGYFDDDGGAASYSATLSGTLLDSWQADLDLEDSNTGSDNFVTRTVARGVAVNTGDNITLQSIREGYDYAYLDYVEFIAHDPTAPIRVEAEYMTLSGSSDLYTSNISTVASTGRAIRSTSTSSSNTVEGVTTFTGATGVYDIVVAYFDENDGQAQLSISQGTNLLESWVADQNLGSSSINAATYTTRTISGVALTNGDEIRFTSLKQGYDYGAIDYIEFQPFIPNSSSTANSSSTPNSSSTFQLEVESMDLSIDANITGASFASGDQFVQVQPVIVSSGDDDDDDSSASSNSGQFKATSLFTGESGYYDVVVGYYDENDGIAEIIVNIDNQEADRWFADQNLGTSSVNANSFTTRTVASGLYINQTDLIELTAIKDGGEQGAIDYIQFIAVDDPTPSAPEITNPAGGNADVLRGGAGNDILDGGLGNDILYGEDEFDANQAGGNDTIFGGDGDDILFGNSGDDILYGDFDSAAGETITVFESSFEGATSTGIVAAPLDGWDSSDGYIEVWASQSADGNNHIELNEDPINYYQDTRQISRQIETIAGRHYTLTFQYAPRNGFNASVNAMEVRLGDETLLAIAEDGVNHTSLDWRTYSVSFDGDGNTKTLEFVSTGQAVAYGRGAHLDDIKLIAESSAGELSGEIYNGSRYLLTDSTMTWEEAQAYAESLGGNLVTINDAAENQWLKDTFGTTEGLWIGFSDAETEGVWKWASGEVADWVLGATNDDIYTDWAPYQPDDAQGEGGQDYAILSYIWDSSTDKWDDTASNESFQLRGVIEIKLPPELGMGNELTAGNDSLTGGSGNDTLYGGAGDDILNGTDSVAIGLNEQDTLMGGDGADQFILGDANSAYYNAGGSLDYALIQDFTAGIDTVQLHGSAADYQQSSQAGNVFLYHGITQDLVAQFEHLNSLDFNSNVTFV